MRIQFQAYNIFNQLRFTTLNAALAFAGATATTQNSSTVAQYSTTVTGAVIRPRQLGLTVRRNF
jgi:hypothetical protein